MGISLQAYRISIGRYNHKVIEGGILCGCQHVTALEQKHFTFVRFDDISSRKRSSLSAGLRKWWNNYCCATRSAFFAKYWISKIWVNLLLQCGDIEENPGPQPGKQVATTKNVKERKPTVKNGECSICQKKYVFSSLTRYIKPDSDKFYYHCKKCANGPKLREYRICTMCHRDVEKPRVVRFNLNKYDCQQPVVRNNLKPQYRLKVGGIEYICRKCMYHLNAHLWNSKPTTSFNPCEPCRNNSVCSTKRRHSDELSAVIIPEPSLEDSSLSQASSQSHVRTWLQILGDFQGMNSYAELENYIQELGQLPEVPPLTGNKHLECYFRDRSAYEQLPNDCPVPNAFPVATGANGNCFLNSLSLAVYGDETHADEMRVRIIIEAVLNIDHYLNHDFLTQGHSCSDPNKSLVDVYSEYILSVTPDCDEARRGLYMDQVFDIRLSRKWCGIWQFHQAAGVLKRPIYSIYPVIANQEMQSIRHNQNRLILPWNNVYNEPVYIMWSKDRGLGMQPNHFVLVVPENTNFTVHDICYPVLNYCNGNESPIVVDSISDISNTTPVTHEDLSVNFSKIEAWKCIVCQKTKAASSKRKFKHAHYNWEDETVKVAFKQYIPSGDDEYICTVCKGKLTIKKLVAEEGAVPAEVKQSWSCIVCSMSKSVANRRIFKKTDYDWEDDSVKKAFIQDTQTDKTNDAKRYICRGCKTRLQINRLSTIELIDRKCLVCNISKKAKVTRIFQDTDYDWDNDTVKMAFQHYRKGDNLEHICIVCRSNLWKHREGQPKLPKFALARTNIDANTKARNVFKKCCRNYPEYICTVCHRMLFQKSVLKFDIEKFDITNPVVLRSLSYRYQTDGALEYICHTCKSSLRLKDGPRMPAQAVANGLVLDEQPSQIKNLSRMERRCIAGKIPFMNIQSLQKGGQNKISGPCVNVPASLEPMCKLLPRIPEHLKLVVVKLKRKLTYKSWHMCEYINPHVVMNALLYLKAHHPFYKNVIINEQWYQDLEKSADYQLLTTIHEADSVVEDESLQKDSIKSTPPKPLTPAAKQVLIRRSESDEVDNVMSSPDHLCESSEAPVVGTRILNCKSTSRHRKVEVTQDFGKYHMTARMTIDNEENSDDEFEENQLAADRNGQVTLDPSPTCIQIDRIDELIFSIAPGENSVPQMVLCDEDFEVVAFPDYFPEGRGAYHNAGVVRERKLDLRRYVNQRLQHYKGTFAKDIDWIFSMQYMCELSQLQSAASMALRTKTGLTSDGSVLNAGMLKDSSFIQDIVQKDHAYKFMKQVRGTPAYWQGRMYDALAMMKTLGKPTWFLTLSPAEFHWVEMVQACGIRIGKNLTDDEVQALSWGEKAALLRTNPVTCCQIFLNRVDDFFKEYIVSDACPLGKAIDYFWKIEFQARGSPHAHCLIWIKDAPVLNEDDDEDVIQFIDEYCTGEIPINPSECKGQLPSDTPYSKVAALAEARQSHRHSHYCRRHPNAKCRFGFGKAPSSMTLICRPPGADTEVDFNMNDNIIQQVRDQVEKDNSRSLSEVLEDCSVSETDYVKALQVSRTGTSIILKREPRDMNINNYNYNILSLWKANIDVQYVENAYSAIMYVCSYVMKAERGMSDLIRRIAKDFEREGVKSQMKNIIKGFSGKREVSIQEAVMRVLSMPLFHKTREVYFVNSSRAGLRPLMPKRKDELDALPENSEDIFMRTLHDRYEARPDELEDMCLAEFAVSYSVINEREFSADGKKALPRIKLKNEKGYMRKRAVRACMRTNKHTKDTEQYYYGKLLLFCPYRSECEIGQKHNSVKDHFMSVYEVIAENSKLFNCHDAVFDAAYEEYEKTETSWDATVKEGTADNNGVREKQSELPVPEQSIQSSLTLKYRAEARKDVMANSAYYRGMRCLNAQQKQIVMFNRAWCKKSISQMKAGISPEGYKIFLSGSGGTGKSHVVHLINRDMIHLFTLTNAMDPKDCISDSRRVYKPTSLLTALTGTAAFNIGGTTLHSTLQLQARTISDEKKCVMQTQLHQLQLLIWDECSMMGLDMLNLTNERCSLIKREEASRQNFGRICVLAVGDLYQLPAVCQRPMYKIPREIKNLSEMAPLLWHNFQFHELTKIMRQKDVDFARLLNEVRLKVPTENDHIDIKLKQRVLHIDEDHPDYPRDVLHVYARNVGAKLRNEKMLGGLEGPFFKSKAIDSGGDCKILKLSSKPTDTGNLEEELVVKVGARVILTNNIDVTDGLTNGAYGTIAGIITVGNQNDAISTILVKFDSVKVGQAACANGKYKANYPGCVPITRADVTFPANQGSKTIHVTRSQFPLFLAWAVTIHKVQGMTLDEIVVDMSTDKGHFNYGQAYVALSRVTSYEKLHIIGYNRHQFKVNKEVTDEMERLKTMRIDPIAPSPILCLTGVFKIGHLNIQGGLLGSEVDKCIDLQMDMDIQSLDILCLTETHLHSSQRFSERNLSMLHCYGINRRDRPTRCGGVMMAIKNDHIHSRIDLACDSLEIVCSGVENILDSTIYVFCVYIPPSQNKQCAAENLGKILDRFVGEICIILGDMNEDLLKVGEKSYVHLTLTERGFIQHIKSPTTDHASLLDHIYSFGIPTLTVDVQDAYYSDHDKTLCAFNIVSSPK